MIIHKENNLKEDSDTLGKSYKYQPSYPTKVTLQTPKGYSEKMSWEKMQIVRWWINKSENRDLCFWQLQNEPTTVQCNLCSLLLYAHCCWRAFLEYFRYIYIYISIGSSPISEANQWRSFLAKRANTCKINGWWLIPDPLESLSFRTIKLPH